MTPEEARGLLEAATPGPWDCVGQDEEYPRVARVGYQDITNDATNFNAPLIAAAPELAELVAGLRYEYLVQEDVGYWRDVSNPFDDLAEAREFCDMKREDAPMRIVRRVAGEWEVIPNELG